ncbi:3-(3-hydroxy-phenyl)propionate hydroxylase [Rhizobiales bacterium GAS188]|nr:3-(3-hydroxy-phenyl)propionate hydroxylase [Rhizobiales bacterium GAS188]
MTSLTCTSLSCDVAIIGAGPTGLTLANLLGQVGLNVVLVERNEGTVTEPRAVSIDDESLRTMQAIGLADAVIKDVALDYGSHYVGRDGRCFAKVEPSTLEYGFPRRNAFTQPKLEATLREGLRRFANVTALFGCQCRAVAEDDAGVALDLQNADGEGVALRALYVAACDGARSAIREHIGATLTGSTYRQRWLIVDLGSTKERLRQTRVVCDPARPMITLPGPNGIRRYEFMLHDGEDEERATDPDFVRALLAANGPDADASVIRRRVYAFHARIADRWATQRVFLAGDAAHLSPPFAGQGMNSGIRDAHNLGWKLAAVVSGRIGTSLLDSYQRERAPHAAALIQLAVNMGRIMMPRSRLQARLTRGAFRLAGLLPGVQSYFAQMKYKPKPFYKQGFVIPDQHSAIVGRMLPQPLVERADRTRVMLDELIGPRFSLIAYGADAQRALAAAARLDFGVELPVRIAVMPQITNPDPDASATIDTVRDVAGTLSSFMPRDRTMVLLVRPDRYIGAAADPASLTRIAEATRSLIDQYWGPQGCSDRQAAMAASRVSPAKWIMSDAR